MQAYFASGDPSTLVKSEEVISPKCAPGQVRVQMVAMSLNYRDLMQAKGTYNRSKETPKILGSDGAGIVSEVGSDVNDFKIGDRVVGSFFQNWYDGPSAPAKIRGALGGDLPGVLSDESIFQASAVVKVPDSMSLVDACTFPCAGVTAWSALYGSSLLKPGDMVLVQGTGGVSIFAAQLALASGLRVIATSSSDEKLTRLRKMGAHGVINYKNEPEWSKPVRSMTNGVGVQRVVEVGGANTLSESVKSVAMNREIAIIGVLSGGDATINIRRILTTNIRIRGIFVGPTTMLQSIIDFYSIKKLEPIINDIFAFHNASEAFLKLESGSHFGKIVIQIDDSIK